MSSRRVLRRAAAVGFFAVSSLTTAPREAHAGEARTKVILNGELVPVTFNDGDSFRVLAGSYKDGKARIAGYNTLESHGAVHQWGSWTLKEMYINAKMATMFARKGIWECSTDGETDTYGRMLVSCPELAKALVSRGMAHAMSVTDDPADAELLTLQHEAQAERRGFWAHGIPDFVLTSIHSAEEDVSGKGTYNRLVSTDDGHSVKWKHETRYAECFKVCHKVWTVDASKLDAVAADLKDDATTAPLVAGLSDAELGDIVAEFAEFHHIGRAVAKDNREPLKNALLGWASEGRFGEQTSKPSSCMVHVPFERRYGTGRASCLK